MSYKVLEIKPVIRFFNGNTFRISDVVNSIRGDIPTYKTAAVMWRLLVASDIPSPHKTRNLVIRKMP